MEEMINKELIKKLRSEKCWSQEHLSLVSGLSLRTVQRIENEGKCSFDSKKAIASAFDLDPKSLSADSTILVKPDDVRFLSALSWLQLLDCSKFESSWDEAGKTFQARVSRPEWVEKIKAVRRPLGSNQMRNIRHGSEHETLPGAPDGIYSVLLFDSIFTNKRECIEKIVIENSDRKWRVVGYFIQ